MLTLINEEVYKETLDLIDRVKEPDPVLKGMQLYYASYGIRLYNLYISTMYGKPRIAALTNVVEGSTRIKSNLKDFDKNSLLEYERLCKMHGKDISGITNFDDPNRLVLGTGFYFDRIWRTEIIGRAGNEIKANIEAMLANSNDNHRVVNSGLGSITVFQDSLLDSATKNSITTLAKETLTKYDRWGICRGEKLIVFDTLKNLNEKYGGNLYYYYK